MTKKIYNRKSTKNKIKKEISEFLLVEEEAKEDFWKYMIAMDNEDFSTVNEILNKYKCA